VNAAIAEGIAVNPAPQLLVGGTADDLWDRKVARDLAGETRTVCEIADVDHIMMAAGDAVRGVEAHVQVVRAVDEWLVAALASRARTRGSSGQNPRVDAREPAGRRARTRGFWPVDPRVNEIRGPGGRRGGAGTPGGSRRPRPRRPAS